MECGAPKCQHSKRNYQIIAAIKEVDADILVLTETNALIHPGTEYKGYSSTDLTARSFYKNGENRTTIWTKYVVKRQIAINDPDTCICLEIQTPIGGLNVYGTIIGILGNRINFQNELDAQIKDWKGLCENGNLCIAGDYNISFGDNYYFTHDGRQKIKDVFASSGIKNLTGHILENIDHIAISYDWPGAHSYHSFTWNEDKKLSDHIGVCVEML